MGWDSWVEGKPSDQAALYREHEGLFTREAVADTATVLAAATDSAERKALSFFKAYQEIEYIGKKTAVLGDIQMDLEANLWVTIDGKPMRYRELDRLLSTESDRKKRATYAEEEYRVYDILNNVVLKRQLDEAHRLAKDLGYGSYLDLAVAYRMFDAKDLAARCERFLERSEPLYLSLFDKVSPVPRAEFRRSDTLFLLGGRDFDAFFARDTLVPRLKNVLGGLGIDLVAQKNLRIDDREIETKVPRAVCFAIDVPADVRLSIKPVGGKEDFSSLFHEMGHGQHFANARTPVWEFQQLGSNAVTETYAYLFEYLTENPRWIAENTTMDRATRRKFADAVAFGKLYMVRRYMSKFLYETRLHAGDADPKKSYQTLMSRGYGYALNDQEASRYLSDVDAFLYSADYVQAFFLEAQLARVLEKRFGPRWWTNRKAGDFLKGLFAYGNELSGRELAEKLGYPQGFDETILFENLRANLN
jgi:hypothetical protein